ncbi:hypothetical protein EUX98_g2401 [Antrodiella citrinella]|uniref:Uncharacterized protein n=1 Tax=Antrodiella citrinella TaxID=2447956 RepID=A0A4S4MZ46_9APHY|nr:hypothetical protein EUX98_g2401 [Antrodiella citrinella]
MYSKPVSRYPVPSPTASQLFVTPSSSFSQSSKSCFEPIIINSSIFKTSVHATF